MVNYDVKKNAEYFSKIYANAVELFAFFCQEFKLDPIKDIYCHCELHKLGYCSNHSDVMQWFPKHGKSMDTFKADVKAAIEKRDIPAKIFTPESDPKDIKWAQRHYNVLLPNILGLIPLKINGIYGLDTRFSTLLYLRRLGWGDGMKDDGTKIGKATKEALAAGRIK